MGNRIDPLLCNEMTKLVLSAMAVVADKLPDDEGVKSSWATIETYVATAAHVFSKTNPSKLREAAQTVAIQNLIRSF